MKLTDKESNDLQKEIDHILDSGTNSIRILNMIDTFLINREKIPLLHIKTFALGNHCFGNILYVNEIEYKDLNEKEVIYFILNQFNHNINRESLIRETFQNVLEHLEFDNIESDSYHCETCGDTNNYNKYARKI